MALEGPKIAPHTLTHTGVIVQQWESKRESENAQHGWREEGKYRKDEGGRRGGDEGTSGTENEKDMTMR